MTPATEPEILTVAEVAKLLRCCEAHVRGLLKGRTGLPPIPHVKAGRKPLIRRERLMQWMEEQENRA